MQRYFAKEKLDNTFILRDDDIYHIKTVMRMVDGDLIHVVYDESTYLCCLENVKKNIQVIIKNEVIEDRKNVVEVTLLVPILKEQKMDFILQKATELGVYKIVPIMTERSIIRLDSTKESKKIDRWKRIVKEASEQSYRNTIPIIGEIIDLKKIQPSSELCILCSTQEKNKNIKNLLQSSTNCDKMTIVMGPEGGLSVNEEEYLKKIGFNSITLGKNIMRVETVPIFVLSIINYENME